MKTHGKNDALALGMAREALQSIPKGRLASSFNHGLFDVVHSLSYEKDTTFDTLKGKLTPGYLLARVRGKHEIKPAEKRQSWAAGPAGLEMRTYSPEQISTIQSLGARFIGMAVPPTSSNGNRTGKTVFREAAGIAQDLATLSRDVKAMLKTAAGSNNPMDAAMIAAHFKQHFIAIHPYMDGNGRVSRLISERILAEFDIAPPNWKAARYDLDVSIENTARLMLGQH